MRIGNVMYHTTITSSFAQKIFKPKFKLFWRHSYHYGPIAFNKPKQYWWANFLQVLLTPSACYQAAQ